MAKYRAAKASKGKEQKPAVRANAVRAIPCLVIILGAIGLFAVLFYSTLKQAGR